MITRFEYNPEYQTIVKLVDGTEVDRLSVLPDDLFHLSFYLSEYLKDKKFSIEVYAEPIDNLTERKS